MKAPKIKIPKVDLATFASESLILDHYWDDLVSKGDESYRREKQKRKQAWQK